MMKLKQIPALAMVLAMLAFAACAGKETQPFDRSAVVDEVNDFLDQWVAAVDAGRVDELDAMYSRQEDFVWAAQGRIAFTSADETVEDHRQSFAVGDRIVIILSDRKITPLDKDAATLVSPYQISFDADTMVHIKSGGILTAVLLKEDGRWRFLQGHLSGEFSQTGLEPLPFDERGTD